MWQSKFDKKYCSSYHLRHYLQPKKSNPEIVLPLLKSKTANTGKRGNCKVYMLWERS